uniref:Uncharacterized protein n=1 Tax=Romanomermis culicivorax TaxID=13658 RepID=A0A915K591_ROMCU
SDKKEKSTSEISKEQKKEEEQEKEEIKPKIEPLSLEELLEKNKLELQAQTKVIN